MSFCGNYGRQWVLLACSTLAIGIGPHALATSEYRELFRGARAQAMGNAFSAVADDEQALYYNPAGLAGIESSGLTLVNADGDFAASLLSDYKSVSKTLSGSLSASTLNSLVGKDIYARGTMSPTYVAPNFALGFLADQQLALRTEDRVVPMTNLGYQSTLGVQVGFGFSLTGKRRKVKDDFRVGFAAKVLWRRGGYFDLPLSKVLTISEDEIKRVIGGYHQGFGGDVGLQWVRSLGPKISLKSALVWQDIGNTTFEAPSAAQMNNLTTGVAGVYEQGFSTMTLSADYRQLQIVDDWRKHFHLGAEWSIPILSLYAGLSQMLITYGASTDLGLVRVTVLSYGEQLGTFAFQDTERRYMLHVALRFGF